MNFEMVIFLTDLGKETMQEETHVGIYGHILLRMLQKPESQSTHLI